MMRSPLFNELLSLRDTVDHIFRENPWGDTVGTVWSRQQPRSGKTAFPMPLDIYSNDDEVVILAAVPGMRPDDLDLTIQKNTVMISGELHPPTEGEGTSDLTWYARELAEGVYRRSVTLPFLVDSDKAEATFEHGILRIVLPKAEESRPKKVAIMSGGKQEAISAGSTSGSTS
jgi:HSP20 family protein